MELTQLSYSNTDALGARKLSSSAYEQTGTTTIDQLYAFAHLYDAFVIWTKLKQIFSFVQLESNVNIKEAWQVL